LRTCSLYKCVYDHVCTCIYFYPFHTSSTYERKHVTFFFLNLTYFTWHDVFQFNPFNFKWHNFILPMAEWISLVYVSYHHFLNPLISCEASGLFL
jgi:hypothetical protein